MNALTTAATGMVAQQQNLDTIANNLSNVNTTGYKSETAEFQDLMYQTVRAAGSATSASTTQPTPMQIGLGVRESGTNVDFSQGPIQSSGNPLNLAIQGNGFFQILRPDGTYGYTRDGTFGLDSQGQIVTADGLTVNPAITIPNGASAFTVAADGTVSYVAANQSSSTVAGKLTLSMFPNPAGLERIGQNLFVETAASGAVAATTPGTEGSGTLLSGSVEGSNVQVVDEMVNMISAQRAYEINSKAISTADDMLSIVNGLKR